LEARRPGTSLERLERQFLHPIQAPLVTAMNARVPSGRVRIAGPYVHAVELVTDKVMLTPLLDNLLSNAIKDSHASCDVELAVSVDGPMLKVEVRDRGPGLHVEDPEVLFEATRRRPENPVTSEPSFGLGLAVVREMTNACDGLVCALERRGGGAIFRVDLPLGM
jgi:K+-sensing histidine kinase KdpD